jgi:hypothetical protein
MGLYPQEAFSGAIGFAWEVMALAKKWGQITIMKVKSALELFASCLFYSLIAILIDIVLVLLLRQELNQVVSSLSFIILIEGALGLIVGGAVAFFSPLRSKMDEVIFHSKPWNATSQKEAEKQARTWILTGAILVFAALLASAL